MRAFSLLALLLFLFSQAQAGVNLKNGNFYISYTDLIITGAHEIEIVRTYNSRAGRAGFFGIGWGSDLETYLTVQGDGSLVINENGSGARTYFNPPRQDQDQIIAAVDQLIAAIDQDKPFKTDAERQTRRDKLLRDEEQRSKSWTRYVEKGLLKPLDVPIGTVFRSQQRGSQQVIRTRDGYQRSNNRQVDEFDKDGNLTRIQEADGALYDIYRDDEGRIARIVNGEGKHIQFHWNPDNRVVRLDAFNGKSVFYLYDDKKLIESKDVAGNIFRYSYDDNHNMTAIRYKDGSSMTMTYTGGSEFVRSIKSRDGDVSWYDYGYVYKKRDEESYYTEVTKPGYSGQITNRYEYTIATLPSGRSYTRRIKTRVNGLETTTDYDVNGTPTNISRGKYETGFEYDAKGRLTRKVKGEQVIELSYDDRANKISKVVKYPVFDPSDQHVSEFAYDPLGNLIHAKNSDGKEVRLSYNDKKQIIRMEAPNKTLTFEHNHMGKPILIAIEGVGQIEVEYDEYGEITKVNSEAGHRMALQVTQAFQSLLALVKPAGVNLNL